MSCIQIDIRLLIFFSRITCFEDFSNELFLDIFDYFEGFDLYHAFSNLNTRFENLLGDRSLHLKMKPKLYVEDVRNRSSDLINLTRDRIISLDLFHTELDTESFPRFTIDSSFSRLESLELGCINSNAFVPLLVGLLTLPRLLSLSIQVDDEPEEMANIYQVILNMPILKYSKISFYAFETSIPLPMATNGQFSRIKYLNIDHPCALNDLINILSYTPQLRRLVCEKLDEWDDFVPRSDPLPMSHLTHIFFGKCFIVFDEMEMLITKISPPLKTLCLTCSRDPAYLNADRWERIICKNLTQLHVFNFKYEEAIDGDFEITAHHERILRFNSSFWINRKWSLKFHIDRSYLFGDAFVYAVGPNEY